jgi:hypothetical protein
MKYLLSLSLGIVTGAVLLVAILYFNPFSATAKVSPLALTDNQIIDLSFNAAPADTLLFTNDGKSVIKPHPERVPALWEQTIENSWVTAVRLTNARGETQGIGIKFSSESENTEILGAKVLVNSVWHVYLANRGSFFIDQTENYWAYMRDIVLPAKWSPANSWRGAWHRSITVGPGALGTARVIGESGIFAGASTEAVESLTARAYSSTEGPIAMRGNLTIVLPAGATRSGETAKADFETSR